MSLYAISAALIHIRFREGEITSKQKTSIKNTLKMLLGSEIISESSKEIDIQIFINQTGFPVEKAVRRMLIIALSMDKDIISALNSFDENLIEEIINSDDELDRLNLYVIRQLKYGIEHHLFKEMGFRSPKEFLGYRIATKNIENIGDNAVGVAKNFLHLKKLFNDLILPLNKSIDEEMYSSLLKFHSFGHSLLEGSLKAFFKRDYNLADETISQFMSTGFQLEKDAINLMLSKKMDSNIAFVLRLILNNTRKMIEYARDIAEVTLNRAVEEMTTE